MSTKKTPTGPAHLAVLRDKGWTIRPAAKQTGVSATHLHAVLTGKRHSRRLLDRISTLPNRKP